MLEVFGWQLYYHFLNLFATIVSLLWMYIIVAKSPKEMSQYKWTIFKLALSDELFSLTLGVFFFPDPLFPASAGAILGVGSVFGEWGGRIGFGGTVFFAMTIFTSINDCVFVRSLIIHGKQRVLDFLFKTWWMGILTTITINMSMGAIMWTTMFLGFEDSEDYIFRSKLEGTYVHMDYFVEHNYTIIAMDITSVRAQVFLGTISFGLICLYFANLLSASFLLRTLNGMKNKMSAKTYKAHRSMIIMLLLQNMYPVFSMMLPIAVALVGFLVPHLKWLISSDGYKHWILTSLMGYPIISCIFSVAFITPYREFCKGIFVRKSPLALPVIEVTASVTTVR